MTHRATLLFAWVLPAVDPKQGLACNGPSGRSRECQKDDRELTREREGVRHGGLVQPATSGRLEPNPNRKP